jgi:Ca2+-transporting ATPase
MGRIAGMLKETPNKSTPLQQELEKVGKLLGAIVVVIAMVMIVTIILVENVRGLSALFEVLILGIALAVAAVPESLPTVVTVVLALGVHRLAQRNAIVRHLAAVETLGSADVIASDKTGTLTKNEMTVRQVFADDHLLELSGAGYDPAGEVLDGSRIVEPPPDLHALLRAGVLASDARIISRDDRWHVEGDPTEGALVVAAMKTGLTPAHLHAQEPRTAEIPFTSERRRMTTIHTTGAGRTA